MDTDLAEKQQQEFTTTVEKIKALKITDDQTYTTMVALVLICRKGIKYFDDLYDPRIRQSDDVTKALRTDKRKFTTPLAEAQSYGDKEITGYRARQQREANEKAAAARLAEQKKRDDEKIQLAGELEKAGLHDSAAEVLAEPDHTPMPTAAPAVPKVDNMTIRRDWKARVVDSKAVPREYCQPDGVLLNKMASRLKDTLNIPGVDAYYVDVVVGKA